MTCVYATVSQVLTLPFRKSLRYRFASPYATVSQVSGGGPRTFGIHELRRRPGNSRTVGPWWKAKSGVAGEPEQSFTDLERAVPAAVIPLVPIGPSPVDGLGVRSYRSERARVSRHCRGIRDRHPGHGSLFRGAEVSMWGEVMGGVVGGSDGSARCCVASACLHADRICRRCPRFDAGHVCEASPALGQGGQG